VSIARNLRITLALIATAVAVSIVPAGAQATVCNQASEAQRGDLVPTETSTSPSVRHTTNLAALPGKGKGLETAAANSPALNGCAPPPPPPVDGGDGGDGGGFFPGDIAT
jgi:hypothetical protein